MPTEVKFDKVRAVITMPRHGPTAYYGCAMTAFNRLQCPVHIASGVFRYEQGMQTLFEQCVDADINWIITTDYDTLFDEEDIRALFGAIACNPHVTAVAALQKRRLTNQALLYTGESRTAITGDLIEVKHAHFGLTLIDARNLRDLPKPWFRSIPDDEGSYGDGRCDPDVYFWRAWREAGNNVYIHPGVRIGHLEEMVTFFDAEMNCRMCTVEQYKLLMAGADPGEVLDAVDGRVKEMEALRKNLVKEAQNENATCESLEPLGAGSGS